ncbi:MAG: alpha/beta hydrolase [Verrucomicrobia bacterium]|nr:alpha/beta hydrolase [Verrucomicrobiota bacterium]
MNRRLGWTLMFSPTASLIGCLFATITITYSQIRTVTRSPYPTGANGVAWITNVPYVAGAGPQQQLDLYIPTEGKDIPLVVYIHGGGWEHGDKAGDSLNPIQLQLLWDGYAMASVNYRLAPAATWPAQIQDCKAAIRWLKAHAHQYGYDPGRIAVMGASVGGHLAAMLGTTSGSKAFDVGDNLDSSSDVTCVVNLCGAVADFTLFAQYRESLGLGGNFSFLGGSLKDHMDLAKSANPITYVHVDEPPMLVVHGTADRLVPYLQSELLVEAMDKAGAPYYFHSVVSGGHGAYFGLNFNASGTGFDAGGGGIGLLADPVVEPLIKAFLHHYLLDGRKDLFTGGSVIRPEE